VNEDELKQALSALEIYRAQAESLSEQQQVLQLSLQEYARAKETMANWKKTKEGEEILVPIGGNSFVFAKVGVRDKALVGIGSGVTVERPVDDAIASIDARIKELTEAQKKLGENLAAVEMRSSQLTQAVQVEYDRLQRQPR
jgi:prefoldin alpha subunit